MVIVTTNDTNALHLIRIDLETRLRDLNALYDGVTFHTPTAIAAMCLLRLEAKNDLRAIDAELASREQQIPTLQDAPSLQQMAS